MVYLVHQDHSSYLTKKHQDKHDNRAKKAIHSKFTKDGHRIVAAKLEKFLEYARKASVIQCVCRT